MTVSLERAGWGQAITHYADEDRRMQPLCGGGKEGDKMTFFLHDTTCAECQNALTAARAVLSENPKEG